MSDSCAVVWYVSPNWVHPQTDIHKTYMRTVALQCEFVRAPKKLTSRKLIHWNSHLCTQIIPSSYTQCENLLNSIRTDVEIYRDGWASVVSMHRSERISIDTHHTGIVSFRPNEWACDVRGSFCRQNSICICSTRTIVAVELANATEYDIATSIYL